jgi:hypothetical protein
MTKKLFVIIAIMASMSWQGCEDESLDGPVDCTENPVTPKLVSSENSTCGLADGRIEVSATGGGGEYQFKIGSASAQATGVFENVAAGVYEITVSDKNNCSAMLEVAVQNQDGLNVTFDAGTSGCNQSNGTLTVNAVNGTQPYQFKLDGGAFGSGNTFSDLPGGDHSLVVTDASGCEVTQNVKIRSGVSFATSIQPIITGNCAVSGCHSGPTAPDLRVFKNIQDNAARIKVVTGNKTMPQGGGSLTQTEINLIACWVDDGALNN